MPALGMAQETGKLVRWLKVEGSQVNKGEPLMEVETDKAVVEVEAPASGLLAAIAAQEGEDVEVGKRIAWILSDGEGVPAARPAEQRPAQPVGEPATGRPPSSAHAAHPAPAVPPTAGRPAASPKARRLAAERGVDLSTLRGSGPGGAVIEDDILQAGAASPAAAEPALWRAMADNVSRSWREAPHFFVIREVDAGNLMERRKAEPGEVTYTDLLVKHVAGALQQHPRMNMSQQDVNIGLAVALPTGLIVPVIHNADRLSVAEIAARRREVVEHVRAGRIRSSDVTGGTFTISNLGMYGVDMFTAILTEGQAGILAVGRIAERVVARDGAPQVRPTMLLSLSCDHRRVDGARAAEFMQTLASALEA
jgi:pyruvate dehydrogenase E2 component (dihydrolipoyllysine-residue acetyltransferase)